MKAKEEKECNEKKGLTISAIGTLKKGINYKL
jgi:hypothetical protein